jgi:hypothetical protein
MVETHRSFLIPSELSHLEETVPFEKIPSLEYSKEVDLDWIKKKGEKMLSDPSYRAFNLWNIALYRRELGGIRQKMSIRWIDPLKGYGLFAEQQIPEMTCIGEYVGVVKKRNKKQDRDNSYIFEYAIDTFDTGYVIDAEKKGNHTRFINHSDHPNLISRWLVVDGLPRVIFFTKTAINKDEELVVDYGPYYWE